MPIRTLACSPGREPPDLGRLDGPRAEDVHPDGQLVCLGDPLVAEVRHGGLDGLPALGSGQQLGGRAGTAERERLAGGGGLGGQGEHVQAALVGPRRLGHRQGDADGDPLRVHPDLRGGEGDRVLVGGVVGAVPVRGDDRARPAVPVRAAQRGGRGAAVRVVHGRLARGHAVAAGHQELGRVVAPARDGQPLAQRDDVVLGGRRGRSEHERHAVHLDPAAGQCLGGEGVTRAVVVAAPRGGGVDAVVVEVALQRDGHRLGNPR